MSHTERDHTVGSHSDDGHINKMDLYEQMLRIRQFEERCVELYSATRIRGFLHLGIGQEAVAVGVVGALDRADRVVASYREHAHALVKGVPAGDVMAEMFGMSEGCSRGRGGSMHLFDVQRGLFGGNAIVAGGLPMAVGLALGDVMRPGGEVTPPGPDDDQPSAGHGNGGDRADRPVTMCFFGDGAMAEGEFHESVNLAALWDLPVIFVCENNLYAMGTALRFSHAQTDLALRASSYGLTSWAVDGMDVVASRRAAMRAVAAVRNGAGPHFLEMRTYRLRAHSMYDAERYRSRDEVRHWRKRDPVRVMAADLVAEGICTDEDLAKLDADVMAWVDEAVAFAEAGTLEPVGDLTRFVTAEDTSGGAS